MCTTAKFCADVSHRGSNVQYLKLLVPTTKGPLSALENEAAGIVLGYGNNMRNIKKLSYNSQLLISNATCSK